MEAKVGLTLACLNIKKLVKMMTGKTYNFTQISQYYWIIGELGKNIKKTNIKNDVCLHSEALHMQGFCHTLITKELIPLAHSNTHSVHTFQVGFH